MMPTIKDLLDQDKDKETIKEKDDPKTNASLQSTACSILGASLPREGV